MKRHNESAGGKYTYNSKLEAMIKEEASKLNIAPYPLDEIKNKVKSYYYSSFTYVISG